MAAAPSPPPTSAPAEDVLPLAAAAAPPAPAPEKEDGGAAGAGAGVSAAGPLPPLQGEGAQCDTCTSAAPRYRCPACHVRSCSLACVKAHKAQKGCDGRAPRTRFAAHVSELPENVLWHGEAAAAPQLSHAAAQWLPPAPMPQRRCGRTAPAPHTAHAFLRP